MRIVVAVVASSGLPLQTTVPRTYVRSFSNFSRFTCALLLTTPWSTSHCFICESSQLDHTVSCGP